MIRPRLRPSMSRRIKYLGVAQTGQKKLGREARRGSHDLRRLVGHANLLDDLLDSFGGDDGDVISPGPPDLSSPKGDARTEDFEELEDDSGSSSGSDTESDAWSDISDKEDHALSRTPSNRQTTESASTEASKSDGDYFSRPLRDEVARKADTLRLHAEASILGGGKKEDGYAQFSGPTQPSSTAKPRTKS